jgi:hypothetical protein
MLETLKRINWSYGRGEVVALCLETMKATIEYGWLPAGVPKLVEHISFRVEGNKVRFRGVTRTIGYQPR